MSVGWGQDCVDGVEVELWGECYNIEETTSLNLSNSDLTGEIPPEIGNLENLTILDLSNVGLNGQIPPEIGNLEKLTLVDLGHNQLTGIPPEIGNLTNLEYLGFNHNQLIGEIPSEIGNLTNLIHIRLNYNQLTGEVPSEIGNLVNLEILKLYNNQFNFVSDSICNLTNLFWSFGNYGNYDSNIYNNNLCPPYPECIEPYIGYQDTSECEEPSLCDEEIEVELWGECYNIEETTEIHIFDSGLTGEIPPEIGDLINLEWLYLSYNQLTGEIPSEISNLLNLEWLYLYGNQLVGEIPDSICNLVENDCFIGISNNQLCPPYPDCLTEEDIGEQDTSECIECTLGDINGDSSLNILDLVLISNLILDDDYNECGDTNSDGELNILDLVILVNIILDN